MTNIKNHENRSPEEVVDEFIAHLLTLQNTANICHLKITAVANRMSLLEANTYPVVGVTSNLPDGYNAQHLLFALCSAKRHAVDTVKVLQQLRTGSSEATTEAMIGHWDQLIYRINSIVIPTTPWGFTKPNGKAFEHWKSLDPVKGMCRRFGIDIDSCETWSGYTEYVVDLNRATGRTWVGTVRQIEPVLSSGERTLLWAMLHAADFSWLADELSDGRFLRKVQDTDGDYRRAVALALLREE